MSLTPCPVCNWQANCPACLTSAEAPQATPEPGRQALEARLQAATLLLERVKNHNVRDIHLAHSLQRDITAFLTPEENRTP